MSATKTYAGYKEILIAKLEVILGKDNKVLFDNVYGVNETNPESYPIAFVMETAGAGTILDTNRNEREWQFSIIIHQATGQKTPEEAYAVVLDAVDRVIETLDQDPLLRDENKIAQCKYVKVVPAEFEFSNQEAAIEQAVLIVAIVDVVNRYISA